MISYFQRLLPMFLCLWSMMIGMASAGQTLQLFGQSPKEVRFMGFKNQKVICGEGTKKDLKLPVTNVTAMQFDPPLKVYINLRVGGRMENVFLEGFKSGTFLVKTPQGERKFSATEIISIDHSFSSDIFTQDAGQNVTVISQGEVVDLKTAIQPGSSYVLHFHDEKVLTSVRSGNYAQRLAHDSRRPVRLYRINVANSTDPVALQFGIVSVPQLWFYDASGALKAKIINRMAEEDIDAAFKKIR